MVWLREVIDIAMVEVNCFSNEKLFPPEEFPFPFKAYNIQQEFMRELYTTLEEGKIGLFESPTGTVLARLSCIFIKSHLACIVWTRESL